MAYCIADEIFLFVGTTHPRKQIFGDDLLQHFLCLLTGCDFLFYFCDLFHLSDYSSGVLLGFHSLIDYRKKNVSVSQCFQVRCKAAE